MRWLLLAYRCWRCWPRVGAAALGRRCVGWRGGLVGAARRRARRWRWWSRSTRCAAQRLLRWLRGARRRRRAARRRLLGRDRPTASSARCARASSEPRPERDAAGAVPGGDRGLAQRRAAARRARPHRVVQRARGRPLRPRPAARPAASASPTWCARRPSSAYLQARRLRRAGDVFAGRARPRHAVGAGAALRRRHRSCCCRRTSPSASAPRRCGATSSPTCRTRSARR